MFCFNQPYVGYNEKFKGNLETFFQLKYPKVCVNVCVQSMCVTCFILCSLKYWSVLVSTKILLVYGLWRSLENSIQMWMLEYL